MNLKLWRGLTATVYLTSLGLLPWSPAAASSPEQPRAVLQPGIASGQPPASQTATESPISKIETYESEGQQAATLYVRNIPVLTFLGDSVPQASEIASQLEALIRSNFDASTIAVVWNAERDRYLINAGNQTLVELSSSITQPDATANLAADALQTTNRLRRLIGNAPPLLEIAGKPEAAQSIQAEIHPLLPKVLPTPTNELTTTEDVLFRIQGWASWYGPGFDGNYSANGEVFDQYAMTAAHKDLPFNTLVRVTNLDNGRSVVVRINDRGPYIPGREIDLSTAAADEIGMIDTGTAPVKIEVLDDNLSQSLPAK